jgi:hypothetical protein
LDTRSDFLSLSAAGGGRVTGEVGYVASFDPKRQRNDELAVVDLDSKSPTYRQILR